MDNVRIEVHFKVIHEKGWSEATTIAEASVSSKGTYSGQELAIEVAGRIAEATTLLRGRLTPAIAEQLAIESRKADESKGEEREPRLRLKAERRFA